MQTFNRIVFACSLSSSILSFGAQASCLDETAAFAERLCGAISNKGSSTLISSSGDLSAEAKGIIARALGTAQGDVKVNAATSSYENVVREELAKDHYDARQCNIHMADMGVKQVCPPKYGTCRHPDFGQAGWGQEQTLNGTTGWRGGGYNQGAYCTDFSNSVVASHSIGSQPYNIAVVGSSEEGRWTGTFNRDRQYNYHCTIKLSWIPVYNEGTGPSCGIIR